MSVSRTGNSYRNIQDTHPFHPEATGAIHHLEEVFILLASEPVQSRNFKVGPEMAHVVDLALHGFGINLRQRTLTGLGLQYVLGQWLRLAIRILGVFLGELVRGNGAGLWRTILVVTFFWLEEHLPQALALQAVLSLVRGSISEYVGHRLFQLLDGDGEAIGFVVALHVHKGIVGHVAEVLDFGLHSPVPVVFLQQLVLVEEARVEATHVMVGLHASIHDGSITLLPDALFCDIHIGPIGIAPMLRTNLAKLDGSRGVVHHRLFERAVEFSIVEKDIGVVKPAVEMSFYALQTLNDSVQLLVSRQHHKSGICAWSLLGGDLGI